MIHIGKYSLFENDIDNLPDNMRSGIKRNALTESEIEDYLISHPTQMIFIINYTKEEIKREEEQGKLTLELELAQSRHILILKSISSFLQKPVIVFVRSSLSVVSCVIMLMEIVDVICIGTLFYVVLVITLVNTITVWYELEKTQNNMIKWLIIVISYASICLVSFSSNVSTQFFLTSLITISLNLIANYELYLKNESSVNTFMKSYIFLLSLIPFLCTIAILIISFNGVSRYYEDVVCLEEGCAKLFYNLDNNISIDSYKSSYVIGSLITNGTRSKFIMFNVSPYNLLLNTTDTELQFDNLKFCLKNTLAFKSVFWLDKRTECNIKRPKEIISGMFVHATINTLVDFC